MTDVAGAGSAVAEDVARAAGQGPAAAAPGRVVRAVAVLRVAFAIALALQVALGIVLVARNVSIGTFDSRQNLVAARSIAEGHGFNTSVVTQHVYPESLPGPEIVRPPGAPYLLGLVFAVFGVNTHAHVALNIVLLLLTTALVWGAIRAIGPGWLADAGGLLILLSHSNYELVSYWNNGILTALAAACLFLAVARDRLGLRGGPLAAACAFLTAAGFLAKPTFLLGAGALTLCLTATGSLKDPRWRSRDLVLYAALVLVLTSPYWVRNIVAFGTPLFFPGERLGIRYGLSSPWLAIAAVGRPLSYADVLASIGAWGIVSTEVACLRDAVAAILRLNPVVALAAAGGVLLVRRGDVRLAAAALALLLPPLFDSFYAHVEERYFWSAYPSLILLSAMAVQALRQGAPTGYGPRRRRIALAALLAGSVALALPETVLAWRHDLSAAARPDAPWRSAVAALPQTARVLAWDAPGVAWYGRRAAIIVPVGDSAAVDAVVRFYRPTHLLLENGWFAPAVEQTAGTLRNRLSPLARGNGWALLRISLPPAEGAAGASRPAGSPLN